MIAYLFESTLILLLLFGAYKLLLEGEKAYQFNRFFLIGALIFGLIAPLVSVDINIFNSVPRVEYESFKHLVAENELPVLQTQSTDSSTDTALTSTSNAEQSDKPVAAEIKEEKNIALSDILIGIYFLGLGFLGLRLGIGLRTLFSSLKDYETTIYKGKKLFLADHSISPFTVFSWIFISKEDFKAGEDSVTILEHELTHARQLHTLDVLFIEVLKIMFWFNPAFYFYKRAIQLNHEFIADQIALNKTKDIPSYQKLILSVTTNTKCPGISSSIIYPATKKRFFMMTKTYSPFRSYSKKMLLFPFLTAITMMFCTTSSESDFVKLNTNNDTYYYTVDLYMNPSKSVLDKEPGIGLRYNADKTLFTGNQEMRFIENDKLRSETIFNEGQLIGSVIYDTNEDTIAVYQYGHMGDRMVVTEKFNDDGLLVEEWILPTEENPLGSVRYWHSNGQLKFEMTFEKEMKYHGLMTMYDEEGNVIEQERYEDGELIEKIK